MKSPFVAGQHKQNTAILIAALESGKFTHTDGTLEARKKNRPVGHCCLGVACRLAGFKRVKDVKASDAVFIFPNKEDGQSDIEDNDWWRSMFGGISKDVLIGLNDASNTGYAPVIAHLKRVNARRK